MIMKIKEAAVMFLDFLKAKNDYLNASHRAFACGLAAASGGNISVRIGDTDSLIVKPSGITLGQADEKNLIITDLQGNLTEGSIKPTKETILHCGLYKALPHIRAVVHVHPVYCIMCANTFDEMPLVTKQMKQISSSSIPILKIKTNTVDEDAMRQIVTLLQSRPEIPGFMLEEHGIVTFSKTAEDAENNAELFEENAKVFWEMKKRS